MTEHFQLPELKLSAHAEARLKSRGLIMDVGCFARLEAAFQLAKSKSMKNAMIMLGHIRLIISVPNATVVTVLPARTPPAFYTGIDGVVEA